ncbi:PDZ and LIM domain protein 2-like isoform X1 [Arapaima gigas]
MLFLCVFLRLDCKHNAADCYQNRINADRSQKILFLFTDKQGLHVKRDSETSVFSRSWRVADCSHMMALTVTLTGPPPWGFRVSGGRDFKKPLTVSKVTGGSKAELANLRPDDIILEINGETVSEMLNAEAQNKIRSSGGRLQLLVARWGVCWENSSRCFCSSPQTANQDVDQTPIEQLDSNPASQLPALCSSEPSATPLGALGLQATAVAKSIHPQPWSAVEKPPSPRGSKPISQVRCCLIFTFPSVCPRLHFHLLSQPPPTCPFHPFTCSVDPPAFSTTRDAAVQKLDRDSEVYKMLQENRESRVAPRQSSTFRLLQEELEAEEKGTTARFSGRPNVSIAGVQHLHTCEKCGTSIITQAVRIREGRYRHPECYVCGQCGRSLSLRGHFWVEDEMFCEKHAQERHRGPATVSPRH